MNIWKSSALIGIYTLAPTHFGTGRTTGAVDLPIARDESTGFPVLPATGLKGVARDYLKDVLEPRNINCLFGKSLEDSDMDKSQEERDSGKADPSAAGRLAFTEARLVAYPVRSLNRPFLHVTCPLILERLGRDLRALGLQDFLPQPWQSSGPLLSSQQAKILVTTKELGDQTLILEDLVYRREEVSLFEPLQSLAGRLAELLPVDEQETHNRLAAGLVVIPDQEFTDLMQRIIPVQARIKLTEGKTTDKWINPEGGVEQGNLWYEEHLPSDCLFIAFIGERRQRTSPQGARTHADDCGLGTFTAQADHLRVAQIGGNETVGQGLCYWTFWPPAVQGTPNGPLEGVR